MQEGKGVLPGQAERLMVRAELQSHHADHRNARSTETLRLSCVAASPKAAFSSSSAHCRQPQRGACTAASAFHALRKGHGARACRREIMC